MSNYYDSFRWHHDTKHFENMLLQNKTYENKQNNFYETSDNFFSN